MGLFSWKKNNSNQEITLLGIKGQISTLKCLLMAEIKEISLKTTLASSESQVDQINSYQYIDKSDKSPTLTQGDFSVSGARAIMTYLDVKGKGNSLLPKKARTLGLQNYWIDVCSEDLAAPVEAVIYKQATEEQKACLNKVLTSLDAVLSENQFIVGQLSLADPHVAAYIYLLSCSGYDLTSFPNIGKWISRLEEKTSGPLKFECLPKDMQFGNSEVA